MSSWAMVVYNARLELQSSFPEFRHVFHHAIRSKETGWQLLDCVQGSLSFADYFIDFVFWWWRVGSVTVPYGLRTSLKEELAIHDHSAPLVEHISLAIHLGNPLRERHRERGTERFPSPSTVQFQLQQSMVKNRCSSEVVD